MELIKQFYNCVTLINTLLLFRLMIIYSFYMISNFLQSGKPPKTFTGGKFK